MARDPAAASPQLGEESRPRPRPPRRPTAAPRRLSSWLAASASAKPTWASMRSPAAAPAARDQPIERRRQICASAIEPSARMRPCRHRPPAALAQAGEARRRPRAAQRRQLQAGGPQARNAAASIPPAASGCFSSASSGDRRRPPPPAAPRSDAGTCRAAFRPSGWPAESSTSMSQRVSSAATRRARPRSGVTSAARLPGSSSDAAHQQAR